jgi:MFS family permease
MDVMLYALVLGQVQREMHLSAALGGAMMSATLIAAAFGGVGFGWFADRFGRVRALIYSVLVYSVATALCGFTQTATQLMLCRVLLGLGMGGEWAAGAALVAETWPARHRGKALALVQSSWAVGYALGALPWSAGDAALRLARGVLRRRSTRPGFVLGTARAATSRKSGVRSGLRRCASASSSAAHSATACWYAPA